MKKLLGSALALVLVTGVARAEEESKFMMNLVPVDVARSEAKVEVVKTTTLQDGVAVLFAIPVNVQLKDACTYLAGQQASWVKVGAYSYTKLSVVGAKDPEQEACIQIYPQPRASNLSYTMTLKNPEANATYSQKVLVGDKWVTVSYKHEVQPEPEPKP